MLIDEPTTRIYYECMHNYKNGDRGSIKRKVIKNKNGETYEYDNIYYRDCIQKDRVYGKFYIENDILKDIVSKGIHDVVYYMEDWDSEYWFYIEDIVEHGEKKGTKTFFNCDLGWLRERYLYL